MFFKNKNIEQMGIKIFSKNKSGIFRKFLFTLLFFSIVPVLVLGIITSISLNSSAKKIVDDSAAMIDKNIEKNLLIQATGIARDVEKFLRNSEIDLFELSELEQNPNLYLEFAKNKKSEVWERTTKNDSIGQRSFIPLYKEIAFIDINGYEKVKIIGNRISPLSALKNVSIPANTTYLNEDYFSKTINLSSNDIYISRLNGFFVSIKEIEESENLITYDGVFRLAMPIYNKGIKKGIVVLGIDHRHFMEFTQHILPNNEKEILVSEYQSGDYAFIFDDEGWIITHPKLWDIRGVDKKGNLVPAYNKLTPPDMIKEGFIPFNLDSAGFIHENYPFAADEIRKKKTGKVVTTNIGGVKKIMVYTPIFYNRGEYKKHGVFGGVTLGTETTKFHSASSEIKKIVAATFNFFIDNIFLIISITLLLSILFSFLLTQNFTKPIIELTNFSKKLAGGELEKRIKLNRNDEIGIMSDSFNKMANELEKSRNELLLSYNELMSSKKDIEIYTSDLEYQLKILKSIQSISNIIGSTFELNTVLKIILRTCVESVNFDRAILYMLDDEGRYLEYREMFGFTDEEEKVAMKSVHNISRADCIETRVVKTGEIIFVDDFENYAHATELDKKIRTIAKSNSFVFVPLRVKEKIIGILGADKLRTGNRISETDINSLQILANQASRVIENTRLYTEIISQRNFVADIVSNMLNGVVSTNGRGIITSINKAAIEILELDENVNIGDNIWNLLENAEPLLNKMRAGLEIEGIFRGYNLYVEILGKTKYLNINASRIFENNIHTGSIIVLEDVSEKKKLDEELQKIDRLASLGKFAAGIAHEIRNPLTGLSLYLDNLHDQLSIQNSSHSKLLINALSEIERLDNLVKEILDYAVPGKSRMRMDNINTVINNILHLSNQQFNKAGIKLLNKFDLNIPDSNMDSEKIKQALLNIIVNSIQFMPGGGVLFVETILIKNGNDDEKYKIIISDTGKGFVDSEIKNIFEPFYSNRKEGIGLGLAITHSIINEHEGTITAKNKATGGALFIITLPVLK